MVYTIASFPEQHFPSFNNISKPLIHQRYRRVRFNPKIRKPVEGWQGFHPSSHGEPVKRDGGDDKVFVGWRPSPDDWNWQRCHDCGKTKEAWCGAPFEIELYQNPKIGDKVQVISRIYLPTKLLHVLKPSFLYLVLDIKCTCEMKNSL